MRTLVVILTALILCTQAVADDFARKFAELESAFEADPSDTKVLKDLAMLCYDEAGPGDNNDAIPAAVKYTKLLSQRFPDDAYYKVLHGSAITMQARPLVWPPKRLKIAAEGNAIMDAAVKESPEEHMVRWVRAMNNYHMPAIVGRRPLNKEDFTWLWENRTHGSKPLDTEIVQQIAICHGTYLDSDKKKDDARNVWKTGLELAPDSTLATELRKLIGD